MSDPFIQEDVAKFIIANIDSIAQLEALLLLRTRRDSEWSIPTLARSLYIDESQTAAVLNVLCQRGFVRKKEKDPSVYQYEPMSSELCQKVRLVAELYAKHLIAVTNLIHSKPKSRVQEFADAFDFRKDKE